MITHFHDLTDIAAHAAFGKVRVANPLVRPACSDADPHLEDLDSQSIRGLTLPMLVVHSNFIGHMVLGGNPLRSVVTVDRGSPVGCVLNSCECDPDLAGLVLPMLQDGWLSIGHWRGLKVATQAGEEGAGYLDITESVETFARLMGALPDGIQLEERHIAHMFNIRSAKLDALMRQRLYDTASQPHTGDA